MKGLEKLNGIHDLQIVDKDYEFKVDNDELGKVIEFVAKHDVLHLLCTPPSLEELFMTHYQNRGDS
jgi:ABC-2 type transport system ATP-binding protein